MKQRSKIFVSAALLFSTLFTHAQCLDATNYNMFFEASDDITGWVNEDVNADSNTWDIYDNDGNLCAGYTYSSTETANDYLFSPCFTLETGKTYELSFSYATESEISYPEKLRVLY